MRDTPNVIFIVVDTLREDYSIPLKNMLRKLGFVSYNNVVAPASWTLPSHVSIFTGLYPASHGVHETRTKKHLDLRLNKRAKDILISYALNNIGMQTYLLTANPFVSPHFGIGGFMKVYELVGIKGMLSDNALKSLQEVRNADNSKFKYLLRLLQSGSYSALVEIAVKYPVYLYYSKMSWPLDKGARNAVNKLKSILTNSKESPEFIFLNLMEVHEPYSKNEGNIDQNFIMNLKTGKLNEHLIRKWRENYPREVTYVSKKIMAMMNLLKEKGIFNNSLIIVTSDHGQLLGEHGRISHGTFLYDELLKVPLLIKYPEGYQIEHIHVESKYISLIKLKKFVLRLINNDLIDDSLLYSDTVFAESYGVHQNVGQLLTPKEKENIERLEKYRIAVYYKDFKGIFNVNNWRFEKIKSYNPNVEVTEEVIKLMRKEVVNFLKTSTAVKTSRLKL